ncbi:MAG TPA: hypothetical protein VFE86_17650, partial [Ilumatobacteraceae bacterium]|nr:hypothetical protein [Ilumatobacteraceae bacterium]
DLGALDTTRHAPIAAGQFAYVGDVIATRRNDRTTITSAGDTVRNRERWTVTDTISAGGLIVQRNRDQAVATLPGSYVREHVSLGYATTDYGNQGDTTDSSITLVNRTASAQGLYVGMTRGRHDNLALIVTGDHDADSARDTLEAVLHNDRPEPTALAALRDAARNTRPSQARAGADEQIAVDIN